MLDAGPALPASFLQERQATGEIPTGLLFIDEKKGVEMHKGAKTVKRPLVEVPYEELCPGRAALDALQAFYR